MKHGEGDQDEGDDDREIAVEARAQRAEDVAAVELRGGDEIEGGGEKADPGGAAYGVKKDVGDGRVRIEDGRESVEDERGAEDGTGVIWVGEIGNDLCVDDAEEQGGNGDDETEERAGCTDVEEGALRANSGANHDEGAEGSDQRWERNEKGIGGVNVVVAAGEVVAEFVYEQNTEKSKSEGQAADERERMFVEQGECVQEFVKVDGFIFGVGGGEVRAGDEAGAEGEEEENDCEQESFERWMGGDRTVLRRWRNESEWLPLGLRRVDGIGWIWNGVCHWGNGAMSLGFSTA